MNFRPARRHYTRAALELWLERLTPEWESRFAPGEVEVGRELYRQGCVRDISVGCDEAVVSGEWDEFSAHVVFDWQQNGLHWRGSLDRPMHNNVLAVAALYEIEELLCEETPVLPSDPASAESVKTETSCAAPASDKSVVSPGATTPSSAGVSGNATAKKAESAGTKPAEKSPHRLVLVFTVREDALIFAAKWDESNRARRAAFGPGAPDPTTLTPSDREGLLRLVTMARKNHFHYDAKHATYRLEALEHLPTFVRDELPKWRERFVVEGADGLQCFVRGVRELDLEALLTSVEPTATDDGDDKTTPDFANDPDAAFALEWRAGVDGAWFESETTRRLLRHGEGVMLVPGKGLVRLSKKRAELVADWPDAHKGGLPRYLLLSLFRDEGLRLDADDGLLAWKEALLSPPEARAGTPEFLRPYQKSGVAWLAHLAERGAHPLLADEMGLGKTLQVLSLVLSARPLDEPTLIVCPASVVPVWRLEIEKFFPGTAVAVLARGRRFDEQPAPRVWIASYSQLRRHKALLDTQKFGYAVLDEAQFIKNPEAKVTQACLAIRATHRLALSGTPIENRPADLWALFRFLMPGLLGRRKSFEDGFNDDSGKAVEKLRAQISPFVLRRTKREVAKDLPQKVESVLPCPLTDLQREEYQKLVRGGLEEFGSGAPGEAARSLNFLSLLTRLRQAACDPGLLPWRTEAPPEQSGKLLILFDKLAEIVAAGRKAVVFSQFTTLLDRVKGGLTTRFPDTPVYELTGATTDREGPVASFQKAKGAAIILVSLRAGGTGVTLTAGDYVFLLDPWWNPAVEAQAVDRVHRIGREKTVFVYRMTATDTVEDRIARLKDAKRELFDRIVGDIPDLSDWKAHFPTLESLIALSNSPESGGEDDA
jgi:hypothetical protein